MMQTVHRLEKFPRFLQRAVAFNGLHAPDDPMHAAMLENRPEAAAALRTLHVIHRAFPEDAPVEEQAAYLVRAFAGLRPFSEANLRTGWDLTAEALQHHGRTILASPGDMGELGNQVWPLVQDMATDAVADRDEAFERIAAWFQGRIA